MISLKTQVRVQGKIYCKVQTDEERIWKGAVKKLRLEYETRKTDRERK